MKLKENINIPAFLQTVQQCKADVLFVTVEGDRLNLRSMLSQFVFTAVIAGTINRPNGRIELQRSSDAELLQDYLTD